MANTPDDLLGLLLAGPVGLGTATAKLPGLLAASTPAPAGGYPSTLPAPVTTPSAGIGLPCIPKLVQRCSAKRPLSRKLS